LSEEGGDDWLEEGKRKKDFQMLKTGGLVHLPVDFKRGGWLENRKTVVHCSSPEADPQIVHGSSPLSAKSQSHPMAHLASGICGNGTIIEN
jgi:hypothetical protein